MNDENLQRWITELRTTTLPQARDHLCDYTDKTLPSGGREVGYCCLGIGTRLVAPESQWLDLAGSALAPPEFIKWLGIEVPNENDHGWDLTIDVPDEDGFFPRDEDENPDTSFPPTAATLNDGWNLTFSQIADMLAYFGVKEQATG